MWCLWVIYWWLLGSFFYALVSIFFSIFRIQLGIRGFYVRSLLAIFSWARRRCAMSGLYMEDAYTDLKEKAVIKRANAPPPEVDDLIKPEGYSAITEKSAAAARRGSFDLDDIDLNDVVDDSLDMAKWGIEVIMHDEVTQSFSVEELPCWNLLTRTDRGYTFVSWRLTGLWIVGTVFRYVVMVPARIIVFLIGMGFMLSAPLVIGWWPESKIKSFTIRWMNMIVCRIFTQAVTLKVTYHDRENLAEHGSICVANHTNFLDFALVGSENHFAVVGQRWRGFTGFVQRCLTSVLVCVWFDRSKKEDRAGVKDMMEEHTKKGGPPILLFPEGVCVNNTTLMRFRKGSFEIGAPIYPVAIKYDRLLGEPFYYQDTWYEHVWCLITSWAIKADVYYLPKMTQLPGESSIVFARRVKEAMAVRGGFVDMDWEGELKFLPVRDEKVKQVRQMYSMRLAKMYQFFDAEE